MRAPFFYNLFLCRNFLIYLKQNLKMNLLGSRDFLCTFVMSIPVE